MDLSRGGEILLQVIFDNVSHDDESGEKFYKEIQKKHKGQPKASLACCILILTRTTGDSTVPFVHC